MGDKDFHIQMGDTRRREDIEARRIVGANRDDDFIETETESQLIEASSYEQQPEAYPTENGTSVHSSQMEVFDQNLPADIKKSKLKIKKKQLHQRNATELTEASMKKLSKLKLKGGAKESEKGALPSNVSGLAFNTPVKRSRMEQSMMSSSGGSQY